MMFGRKQKQKSYDAQTLRPVLKCSICTGETAAGFEELATGKFREVMLIRTTQDLAEFKAEYGITEIRKEY